MVDLIWKNADAEKWYIFALNVGVRFRGDNFLRYLENIEKKRI